MLRRGALMTSSIAAAIGRLIAGQTDVATPVRRLLG